MARRYLPQDVFDIGAAAGARHVIDGDVAADLFASQLAETYSKHYSDDDIGAQWAEAMRQLAEAAKDSYGHAFAIERLAHFTFFRSRYDLSRRRRKWRLLRRTPFWGPREPNYTRVEDCLRNFAVFRALAAAGSVRAPPPNWRLGEI